MICASRLRELLASPHLYDPSIEFVYMIRMCNLCMHDTPMYTYVYRMRVWIGLACLQVFPQ